MESHHQANNHKHQQKKHFVISTADSKYVKPLLQAIIEENADKGWKETLSKDKFTLKWFPANVEDEELIKVLQEKEHIVNRFPGIKGLMHKDMYTKVMKIGTEINSEVYDFVPPQFHFPVDREKFIEYRKHHSNCVFIAKPVASAEGNSIVLFKDLSEIPTQLGQEMVVQRYIHNPLLVDGFKFDLRVYVVIVGHNPLQAFICDEGLARFCTENFKQFFMHLTNYSINKHHDHYTECDNILEPNNATKRTITSIMLTLQSFGVDTVKLQANIRQTCMRALSVYGPLIEHQICVTANNKLNNVNGKHFQILGFDLLPDQDLNCFLLEINDHPSLNIYLEKDYMGGGVGKTVSKIDLYVKKKIVGDTIKLIKKSNKAISETQEFRSLSRILPMKDDPSQEVQTLLSHVKVLYHELAPIKSKNGLLSSNFEKLLTKSAFVKSTGLSSIDMNLIFQRSSEGLKMIDFIGFLWLLKRLQENLIQKGFHQSQNYNHEFLSYDQEPISSLMEDFKGLENRELWVFDFLTVVISKIMNGNDKLHQTKRKVWDLPAGPRKGMSKFERFVYHYQNPQKWQQSFNWDLKYSNDILYYADFSTEYKFELDEFNADHKRGSLDRNSNFKVPELIDIRYDWSYDDGFQGFWEWFWSWYGEEIYIGKDSFYEYQSSISRDQALYLMKLRSGEAVDVNITYEEETGYNISVTWNSTWSSWIGFRRENYDRQQQNALQRRRNRKGRFCPNGYFRNSKKQCQSCATGCDDCDSLDECNSCDENYTLVEGQNFGYCFPDCPKGYYMKTLYTEDSKYYSSVKSSSKNSNNNNCKTQTPTMMITQCQVCPPGCDDCIFDSYSLQPFCYVCKKGFSFNSTSGYCDVTPCVAGEYRMKQFNVSNPQLIAWGDNYDDYLCKKCPKGCKNCTNPYDCSQCFDYFTLITMKNTTNNNNYKQCQGCNAFCNKCNYIESTNSKKCISCDPLFYVNGSSCVLNRTCASGQWFNDATLKCEICPDTCTTCKQGPKNGTIQCTGCKPDTWLPSNSIICVDRCDYSREFYNKSSNSCIICDDQKFPDQNNSRCLPCSKYCNQCIWNKKSKKEECKNCTDEAYIDQNQKKCRINCNQTSYFNFTISDCVSCRSDQYLNLTSLVCQQCPNNCTSCKQIDKNVTYNQSSRSNQLIESMNYTITVYVITNQVECQSCRPNNTIDQVKKYCRFNCSAGLYFDWSNNTCRTCPNGTYFNETTQGCSSCPKGCTNCGFNKTANRVECRTCEANMVVDNNMKLCRLFCYSGTQFYWETGTCRICPPYYYKDYLTGNCSDCPFGCVDCYMSGNIPRCSQCNSSTIYDYFKMRCKLPCNSTQVFNYDTNTCEFCPSGLYFDSYSATCKNCSTNCTSCFKSSYFSINTQCQSCKPGSTLDKAKGECRPDCNSTSSYNWNRRQCQECSSGTFYNASTQTCTKCPSNCSKCYQEANDIKCNSCKVGQQDIYKKKCRIKCNSTSFYNWDTYQCTQCPDGTFYNKTTQLCESCPANCSTCAYYTDSDDEETNDQTKLKCQGCQNDWVLDDSRGLCRPQCNSTTTYDWSIRGCTFCQAGQWLNNTSKQCQNCPTDCKQCNYFTNNKTYQCTSCNDGTVLDTSRKLCIPECSANQYYDWFLSSCTSCVGATFLNKTSMACQTCPASCSACDYNQDTNRVECSQCKSGYIYDDNYKACRAECNSTAYFDWSSMFCRGCLSYQYFQTDVQACFNCPPGCSSCFVNTDIQNVQCSSCNDDQVLDDTMKLCRPVCNSTSYYNWDTLQCTNCKSNEFINQTLQKCQACPSACNQCSYNSDSDSIECQSCNSGFTLDSSRKTCRTTCNSTSYYEWSTNQCSQCKIGQWLNQKTQSCESCSQGCYQCATNSSGLSDCSQCLPGLVLDQKQCRKNCSAGTYFDWNERDCLNCSPGCKTCAGSNQCTACEDRYNFQSNGSCTEKCIAGKETWNSVTKKCDLLYSLSVRLSNGAKIMRCRNQTITATITGLTSSDSPQYSWSYDIISGGSSNRQAWSTQLNSIIDTQNTNQRTTITIPSDLTEKIGDNTTFRFTFTVTSQGLTFTNTTTLVVEPYVFTTINGYNLTYTVDAALGLTLYPQFNYPECPANKGPVNISGSLDIGCKLYDNNNNLMKSLSACTLKPNDIQSGLNYYIKYYYEPNPYQGLRDTIRILTIALKPSCTIANSSLIYVRQTSSLVLSVSVTNQRTTFSYKWTCSPLTSSGSCGVLQSTSSSANLTTPASSLGVNAQYNFTLTIIENSVDQAYCSARVEVINSTVQTFAVRLLDDATTDRNYFDPTTPHNIICQQDQDLLAFVNYEWRVLQKSTSSYLSINQNGISNSGQSLTISANTLKSSDDYDIYCRAWNLKYSGNVTKQYNTRNFLDLPLDFQISPQSGREQDTLFTLSVAKPDGYNLWCKFGYVISTGDVYIADSTTPNFPSASQSLITKLDSMLSNGAQTMFANCYDDSGAYARTTTKVTVNANPAKTSSTTTTKAVQLIRFNTMMIQMGDLQFSDIYSSYSLFSEKLSSYSEQDQLTFSLNLLSQISELSTSLTSSEVDKIVPIIELTWTIIKNSQLDNDNISNVEQTLSTMNSVLMGTHSTQNSYRTMSFSSYSILLSIYNEIMTNYQQAIYNAKMLQDIKESISYGSLRISGNLLPDKDPITIQLPNFAVKIIKKSKQALQNGITLQTFNVADEISGFYSYVNPDTLLQQSPYILITQTIWRSNLVMSDSQFISYVFSNQQDIKLYQVSQPLATSSFYQLEEVQESFAQAISMIMPLSQALGQEKTLVCSFYNEDKDQWEISNSGSIISHDYATCYSDKIGQFAVIDKEYYTALESQRIRFMLLSCIPSGVVYIAFIIGISYMMIKNSKRLLTVTPRISISKVDIEKREQQKDLDMLTIMEFNNHNNVNNNSDKSPNNSTSQVQILPQSETDYPVKPPTPGQSERTVFKSHFNQILSPKQVQQERKEIEKLQSSPFSNSNEPSEQSMNDTQVIAKSKSPIISDSKIYRLLCKENMIETQAQQAFKKAFVANMWLASFSVPILFMQFTNIPTVVAVAAYLAVFGLEVLFSGLESLLLMQPCLKYLWYTQMLVFMIGQPATVCYFAYYLARKEFIQWLILSCIVFAVNNTLQDFVLRPIVVKIYQKILQKFKTSQE